jgi:hypothetical protein
MAYASHAIQMVETVLFSIRLATNPASLGPGVAVLKVMTPAILAKVFLPLVYIRLHPNVHLLYNPATSMLLLVTISLALPDFLVLLMTTAAAMMASVNAETAPKVVPAEMV